MTKSTLAPDIYSLDDFEADSMTVLSIDELDEYEPPRPKLLPIDTFIGLPGEMIPAAKHSYFQVIEEPEVLIDIFEDIDLPPLTLPPIVRPVDKLVRVPVPKPKPTHVDAVTSEQKIFLTHFMGSGTVTTALHKSVTPLSRYRRWLDNSPKFVQAVADATDALADRLESEALKQALSGNTKVLLKSLEALRPAKWGKSSTINTFLEGRMKVEITDWAALAQRAEVVDVVRSEGDE